MSRILIELSSPFDPEILSSFETTGRARDRAPRQLSDKDRSTPLRGRERNPACAAERKPGTRPLPEAAASRYRCAPADWFRLPRKAQYTRARRFHTSRALPLL